MWYTHILRINLRRIIFLLPFLLVGLISGCTLSSEISIANIKANPKAYQGQRITISGKYQGWSSGYGAPPVTRSDWVIEDNTGWIYVTGQSAKLDPVKDIGKEIEVIGKVEMTSEVAPQSSQAYIVAEVVRVRI